MGNLEQARCVDCGHEYSVSVGGGFFFDLLHCDLCGNEASVRHEDLGDIHLRYVKGLGGPYAIARADMDRHIQEQYEGEPFTADEYHASVSLHLGPCACGGRYTYDAPPRCPDCRSTRYESIGGDVCYD